MNKGVRFTPDVVGGSIFSALHKKVSKNVKKSIKNQAQSFDDIIEGDGFSIEGGNIFKKASRGIKKTAKRAAKKVKSEVNDKGNRQIVGRLAVEHGKTALKHVAKQGLRSVIAAPISAGVTLATGNPALGAASGKFASNEIMKRSGADKKLDHEINGLGVKMKRPKAGTQEMKDYMAAMRPKRGKGLGRVASPAAQENYKKSKSGGSFRAPSGGNIKEKVNGGSFRAPSGGALKSDVDVNNDNSDIIGISGPTPQIQNKPKYSRYSNTTKMVGKGFVP